MSGPAILPILLGDIDQLANGPRADACRFGNGLRRLPALYLLHNPLSTARRETGVLMLSNSDVRLYDNAFFLGSG